MLSNLFLTAAWSVGLYRPPDRRILEDVILPWYAGPDYPKVLFVGTRLYTRHYPRMFRPSSLITIDVNPRMALFGATRHLTARIEDVESHVPQSSLDAIVLNGIIGWGVDTPLALDRTIRACRATLKQGGELVLGINPLRAATPSLDTTRALEQLFEPMQFEPLGTAHHVVRTPFPEREHAFSFWRAR
jgi:hypothetical protein